MRREFNRRIHMNFIGGAATTPSMALRMMTAAISIGTSTVEKSRGSELCAALMARTLPPLDTYTVKPASREIRLAAKNFPGAGPAGRIMMLVSWPPIFSTSAAGTMAMPPAPERQGGSKRRPAPPGRRRESRWAGSPDRKDRPAKADRR